MALKHDSEGFLTGTPVDISRAMAVWDDIKKDVHTILQAVKGASKATSLTEDKPRAAITPAGRDARGRFIGTNSTSISRARGATTQPAARGSSTSNRSINSANLRGSGTGLPVPIPIRSAEVPAGRDARGRFQGGVTNSPNSTDVMQNSIQSESMLRGLGDRIAGAVNGATGVNEEVDPAVKAFSEVAQPVARGYQMLAGNRDERKKESWFRRIFGELKQSRKDDTTFNKAANKSLRNLEDRPIAGGDSGGGIWKSILTAILGLGPLILAGLMGLLSKIPLIGKFFSGGAAGPGVGGAGGAGGGAGAGAARGFKGFLKKIPILGALLAGAGAAAEIYGSENDDTKSRRDKDKTIGKASGGFAGTVAGGMAGASIGASIGALGGPIGIAIGGFVGGAVGMFLGDQAGQIIGDTMGGWVNDLRSADIPGRLMMAWESVTSVIASGWDSVVTGFSGIYKSISKGWGEFVNTAKAGWDVFTGLFSAAYEGLKKIPIIGAAIQAAEDAAKAAAEAVKAAAAAAKAKSAEVSAKAVDKGREVAQSVKEKAVVVGAKATEAVKQGAAWVGDNTTVGKGVKAAGDVVNYGTDVVVDTAKSVKSRVTGKASQNKAALVNQMAASGITDPKEQAMFMAQMDHESGGFTNMEERFNYRSADRLMGVSGSARKLGKPAVEAAMAQGPEAVAEAMYGGRMGNVNKGDAYAFRGRGYTQLTGRDNYTAAGKDLGLDLANNPDLASDPENAAKIASWYWKKNKLGGAAQQGDILAVTKKFNGGTNGLDDRTKKYEEYLSAANKGDLTAGAIPITAKASPTPAASKTEKTASLAVAPAAAPPTAVAAKDDPTEGGRYEFKELGGADVSVTDNESGVTEMASDEQAKSYRRAKFSDYRESVAAANNPDTYKSGATTAVTPVAPVIASLSAAPAMAAQTQTAFAAAPTMPTFSAPPAAAEAPPIVSPMASSNNDRKSTAAPAQSDVGQDMKDRRIAHIVTGGFSA